MNFGKSYIGLVNPKSPENVGSTLRAGGCYGVEAIFYTGVRYHRARKFTTDTKKDHLKIPLTHTENLQLILPPECVPVAVEFIPDALPLPSYQHPENALYIFGPEDGSINDETLNWCQDVLYIPTRECMNLAATVNVVLYDRMVKRLKAGM
jgi:tRNA(Leu) C34 or U34 (ribose-2'-O)-methylase TrmL